MLPNNFSSRGDFYTAKVKPDDKMLSFINRARQLLLILKSMDVTVEDKELAMADLNGLPPKFETLIVALYAL